MIRRRRWSPFFGLASCGFARDLRMPCRRRFFLARRPGNRVAHQLDHYEGLTSEQHDEWAESRRYLGLDVLNKSRTVNDTPTEQEETPAALTA